MIINVHHEPFRDSQLYPERDARGRPDENIRPPKRLDLHRHPHHHNLFPNFHHRLVWEYIHMHRYNPEQRHAHSNKLLFIQLGYIRPSVAREWDAAGDVLDLVQMAVHFWERVLCSPWLSSGDFDECQCPNNHSVYNREILGYMSPFCVPQDV